MSGEIRSRFPLLAAPPEASRRVALLETTLMTVMVPVLGYWVHPEDPFLSRQEFFWPLFAPALAALRYGFVAGTGSALGLITAAWLAGRTGLSGAGSLPGEEAIGLLLMGMLLGEFSDIWHRRLGLHRLREEYFQTRNQEFAQTYHLLLESHRRLEERVVGQPYSLRQALEDLYRAWRERPEDTDGLRAAAEPFMAILARFGWVRLAGLYPAAPGPGAEPLAVLGQPARLEPSDPLVQGALESGELVSVRTLEFSARTDSPWLAVAPVIDAQDRVHGLLAIQEMPFAAFQHQHLRLLSLLASYLGDLLTGLHGAPATGAEAASELRFQARSFAHLARRFDLHSMLGGIRVQGGGDPEGVLRWVAEHMRGVDRAWIHGGTGETSAATVLLPATSPDMFASYCDRVRSQVEERFGGEVSVSFQARDISARSSPDAIKEFLGDDRA